MKDPIFDKAWLNEKVYLKKWSPKQINTIKNKTKITFSEIFNDIKSIKKCLIIGLNAETLIGMSYLFKNIKIINVDYSPAVIENTKELLKLNKEHINKISDIKLVCQRMEKYTELDADLIYFHYSLSFSDVKKTIRNLEKNCKKNTVILIEEIMYPFIYAKYITKFNEYYTKERHDVYIKWKKNIVLIKKLLDKSKKFKHINNYVSRNYSSIPTLTLIYKVI
jgi:hypothetical protein